MISVYFKGQPPTQGTELFEGAHPNFGIYYCGAIEFNGPEWDSYWRVRVNPGDVSGDWTVNMVDAVALAQQLARGFPAQYEERANIAADVARDGEVNMIDIVKMVQALANPSIVLE